MLVTKKDSEGLVAAGDIFIFSAWEVTLEKKEHKAEHLTTNVASEIRIGGLFVTYDRRFMGLR